MEKSQEDLFLNDHSWTPIDHLGAKAIFIFPVVYVHGKGRVGGGRGSVHGWKYRYIEEMWKVGSQGRPHQVTQGSNLEN